ncbi:Unknown protein, partial [Striga hermonthica]
GKTTVIDYELHNDLLLHRGRVYVPDSGQLREQILQHFHDSKVGGHSGIYRTWMRIANTFFWPGQQSTVHNYIARCDDCQRTKSDSRRPSGLLQPLPVPEAIWEDITMDFIEGLPNSNGFDGVMVVVDRLTKYAHFIPITHPYTARSIARLFVEYVMKLHGAPRSIVSDRDRIFMSSFWSEFFKLQGTKLSMSSAYHPQTDGQTEVTNRTLEQYLRCYVHQFPKRWENFLPWAEYWYNTTYHESTKMTPFELVYGRKPPTLVNYSEGNTVNDEVGCELEERDLMLRELKRKLEGSINRTKAFADGKRREENFAPGEYVYLKLRPFRQRTTAQRAATKLGVRNYGHYQILKRIGQVAYRVELPESSQIHPVIHVSQLKRSLGEAQKYCEELPTTAADGRAIIRPRQAIEYRKVKRAGRYRWEVLVDWE